MAEEYDNQQQLNDRQNRGSDNSSPEAERRLQYLLNCRGGQRSRLWLA